MAKLDIVYDYIEESLDKGMNRIEILDVLINDLNYPRSTASSYYSRAIKDRGLAHVKPPSKQERLYNFFIDNPRMEFTTLSRFCKDNVIKKPTRDRFWETVLLARKINNIS